MGSFIRLKRVKKIVAFIIRYVWFCSYRALKQDIFFQGSLWLYILEANAYHTEQLSCIVKIIIGPRRDKTCLRGFQESQIQTSLLSYRG